MIEILLLNPENLLDEKPAVFDEILKQQGFNINTVNTLDGTFRSKNIDICFLPGDQRGIEAVQKFRNPKTTITMYNITNKEFSELSNVNCNVVRLK